MTLLQKSDKFDTELHWDGCVGVKLIADFCLPKHHWTKYQIKDILSLGIIIGFLSAVHYINIHRDKVKCGLKHDLLLNYEFRE